MANEYTTFTVGPGTLKMYTGITKWGENSLVSYLSIGGMEQTDLPTETNNYVGLADTSATAKEYIITEDNTEVKIKGFFSLYGSTLPISNVTLQSELPTAWRMFYNCTGLTSVNKFNFKIIRQDTNSSVFIASMSGMFYGCTNLTTLDLSGWDTSQVTRMENMFANCQNLTTLDVSNFDTSQVTHMTGMFSGCKSLTTLDVSNFDTSQVTSMRLMFGFCQSLTTLNLSNFNTSKVTNMGLMFRGCQSLITLNISNFDTSKVTDTSYMFTECNNLNTVYIDCTKLINTKVTPTRT